MEQMIVICHGQGNEGGMHEKRVNSITELIKKETVGQRMMLIFSSAPNATKIANKIQKKFNLPCHKLTDLRTAKNEEPKERAALIIAEINNNTKEHTVILVMNSENCLKTPMRVVNKLLDNRLGISTRMHYGDVMIINLKDGDVSIRLNQATTHVTMHMPSTIVEVEEY